MDSSTGTGAPEPLIAERRRGAVTFAFIARAFEEGKGALHGLTPLFGACVAKCAGNIYEPTAIAGLLNDNFGLEVSPLVVNSMIPALLDAGYLAPISKVGDAGSLFRCISPTPKPEDSKAAESVEELFNSFREFANSELKKLGLISSDDEIDTALAQALVQPEVLGLTLNGPEKAKVGQLTLKKDPPGSKGSVPGALKILCADFIDRNLSDGAMLREPLLNASWGALIAEVVLELQRPDAPTALSGLRVMIDAPMVLDALNVGEESSAAYARDLFQLLSQAGVSPEVFAHSVDEMRAVVGTTLHNIDLGYEVSGPIARRVRRDPGYLAVVRAVYANLDNSIAKLGIRVVHDDSYQGDELRRYFPEELISDLRVWIAGEHLHEHVDRDLRDAQSAAYTMRIRGGSAATSLSQAGAVFVSKNLRLISQTTSFLSNKKLAPAYSVPLVVTDQQLAGVLWFSSGSQSSESGKELTRLKLAANCAKAVQPSPELIKKMREYLVDPQKAAQFEALLSDDRSAFCLVRESYSVAQLQNAEDAERLLETMKSSAIEELRKEVEAEAQAKISEKERSYAETLTHLQKRIDELGEEARDLQASELEGRTRLEAQISGLEAKSRALEEAEGRAKLKRQAVAAQISTMADRIDRAARRRVRAELFVLYVLVVYLIAGLSLSGVYSAASSVLVTSLGFWFAPNITFGRLANYVGSLEAEAYRRDRERLLDDLK